MKVKDFAKKINGHTVSLPVYAQEGTDPDTRRELVSWDFNGYYFDEQDYTVTSISIHPTGVIVHYTKYDGRARK